MVYYSADFSANRAEPAKPLLVMAPTLNSKKFNFRRKLERRGGEEGDAL
jgi:hypothetical protein